MGGNKTIRVNIRVVAASKRNLRMEVERGKFREDLYFRLAVVPVELPPLRERREDIPLLVEHLLASLGAQDPTGETPTRIAPSALDALVAHDWPGNVRELRNVLERAAYLARATGDDVVPFAGVPLSASPSLQSSDGEDGGNFDEQKSYRDTRAEWEARFERRYVGWLLDRHDGNISAAARAADMDRKYLYKLARKHGLR